MANNTAKPLRCAIYTRKSTEHGLELEFNSLDAQREACEAYIKSQASLGWRVLPQPYDDPAFSGGNLERPALKRLLADIEAGKVDVVVVYKIDRLTRSLADFAKLVEAFDAKSISFVAITQQFNTTTSMGRLTLNILLSFAQFERELSSERVRDKIAASRAKGKWTGGNIPFGYRTQDKKLVIDDREAETVRYIFKRYLDLQSIERLLLDLNAKDIRPRAKTPKKSDAPVNSHFFYGSLAYLLNNRVYVGEISHKSKWHPGEHAAIIDTELFVAVQAQLNMNKVARKNRRTESGALFMGKLFDDKGNRMSPSYSTKKGVRYRFYVSTALLRGRKSEAGSISRISATELESAVVTAVRDNNPDAVQLSATEVIETGVERVTISKGKIVVTISQQTDVGARELTVPWTTPQKNTTSIKHQKAHDREPDQKLVRALTRAHARMKDLVTGPFASLEALAKAEGVHPKMMAQELRLASLAPDLIESILTGEQPRHLTLTKILPTLPISWIEQRRLFQK